MFSSFFRDDVFARVPSAQQHQTHTLWRQTHPTAPESTRLHVGLLTPLLSTKRRDSAPLHKLSLQGVGSSPWLCLSLRVMCGWCCLGIVN